jgi:hypothetical protein
LTLPREAVLSDAEGRYVFAVRGGAVVRRPVVVDAASATRYAILSGVNEGDQIAIPQNVDLHDGMPVQIVSELP